MRTRLLKVVLVVLACGCGPTGTGTTGGTGGRGGGNEASDGGVVASDAGTGFGTDGGESCAAVSSAATLGKRPIDIIMVIDNSGSMTVEITGVQDNINQSFARILDGAGLDYRVILLSRHGSPTLDQSICITAPLSGNASCAPPPAAPANTQRFFHYDTEISSTNALAEIIRTYSVAAPGGTAPTGWREWLRPDAFKVFVVITDDNANRTAAQFESALFNLTPAVFGTSTARAYRFHSIIGVAAKANPTDAWTPSEGLVTGKCNTAVNPGSNYQPLSVATGGLRFPLCDPSKYGTVFQTIAQGVVAGATVSCEFAMPPPPSGFTTFNRILVNYTPMGGGTVQSFTKATTVADCAAGRYYVDRGRIILCPQECAAVQADPRAKIDVLFTCEPEIN